MIKSLILSALLSFGTASYEFDCSEILQTRTAPVENIDYSRVLSFTIDNTNNNDDLHFQASELNYVLLDSTFVISGFANNSYFGRRISGYYVEEGTESVHELSISKYIGYLEVNFSSNDVFPSYDIYPDSSQSVSYGGYIFLNANVSLTINTETVRTGVVGQEVYFTLTQVQELAQIFSYYITSYELEPVESLSLIEEIGQVLMWVPGQFVTIFSTLTAVFYADGALTLPGLFLVIGLGVFICALILDFILKFRRI